MYELNKIQPILYHLDHISNIFADKGSHYSMFCPFCNDATRKNNPQHGHCYVSKNLPVYYCHRCGSAGTILKLLIFTGFEDQDTIDYLKSFMKYNFVKDYLYLVPKIKYDKLSLLNNINKRIKSVNQKDLSIFNNYLSLRLGNINYSKFLLYPLYINPTEERDSSYKVFSVGFNNSMNEFCGARLINQLGKIRYKKEKSWYFFQPFKFQNIKNIILSEGMFDILNIFLYGNYFTKNNSFYMSISGKNYMSVIESLIFQELLIGQFDIHIILDSDNKYLKYLKFMILKLVKPLNNDINIFVWKPIDGLKDTGEYPLIEEV